MPGRNVEASVGAVAASARRADVGYMFGRRLGLCLLLALLGSVIGGVVGAALPALIAQLRPELVPSPIELDRAPIFRWQSAQAQSLRGFSSHHLAFWLVWVVSSASSPAGRLQLQCPTLRCT